MSPSLDRPSEPPRREAVSDRLIARGDIVRITPELRSLGHEAREAWRFREVLVALVWRDLRVRYRQTLIGAAWILIQPLLLAAVATLVFGRLPGLTSGVIPYSLFAYLGLWLWGFFGAALTGAANSLVSHAPLLAKVYLPPAIIPLASVATRVVDLLVGLPVLLALMLVHGVPLSATSLGALPLVGLLLALCLGLGLSAASLMVRYRDVGQVLPFALQVGLFVTPVVYSLEVFPARAQLWLSINPLAGIFEGVRASLFGTPLDSWAIVGSAAWTALLLGVGVRLFRAAERSLVDAL
ncbi:MAG: ABC transporter permease [Vicinamibacteria bacterium]|nr:ABC transporter permease [Vicinamibacteria bacterium]